MAPQLASDLLLLYTRQHSEEAFRRLVEGYAGLVHSTALRCCSGDVALAQDAAQLTFIALARHAGRIRDGVQLAAWLHRTASHAAVSLVRSEAARRRREALHPSMNAASDEPDWEALSPLLDESLLALPGKDRSLLTLRYLDGCDLKTVGSAMGLTEDAAGKRVRKALEKLRGQLMRRGLAISAIGMTALLATPPAKAAPPGLVQHCFSAAMNSKAAAAAGLPLFAMSIKTKVLIGSTSLLLLLGIAPLAWQRLSSKGSVTVSPPSSPSLQPAFEELEKALPSRGLSAAEETALFQKAQQACAGKLPHFLDRGIIKISRMLAPVPTGHIQQELSHREETGGADRDEQHYQWALLRSWAKRDPAVATRHAVDLKDTIKIQLAYRTWISNAPADALEWFVANQRDPSVQSLSDDGAYDALERLIANEEYDPVARYLGGLDEGDPTLRPIHEGRIFDPEVRAGLESSIARLPADQGQRATQRLSEFFASFPQ